jgi:hypothetical protein
VKSKKKLADMEEGNVIALRSRLPDHFNKPEVIRQYTGPTPAFVPVIGVYKELVRCKTVGKGTRHMVLHMNVNGEHVILKIGTVETGWGKGWERPVTREAIMTGISEAGNSNWATVSLATQNVHLERHDLLAALTKLDGKLKPREAKQG